MSQQRGQMISPPSSGSKIAKALRREALKVYLSIKLGFLLRHCRLKVIVFVLEASLALLHGVIDGYRGLLHLIGSRHG
jgi:hypothetical protein